VRAEAAVAEPVAHEEAAETPREAPRRREPSRPAQDHRGAEQRKPASDRGRDERRPAPRRRDDEDGDTPLGLGEHVPAFLLRPAVIKKAK
jgi:hypothetical protein